MKSVNWKARTNDKSRPIGNDNTTLLGFFIDTAENVAPLDPFLAVSESEGRSVRKTLKNQSKRAQVLAWNRSEPDLCGLVLLLACPPSPSLQDRTWGVVPSALQSEFNVSVWVWRTRKLLLQAIPTIC